MGSRRAALGTLAVVLTGLAWSVAAQAEPGGKSAATITASFADSCRDFSAHSGKDISYVEVHYTDGRVTKDETIERLDYAIDGAVGDELDSATVKSGRATETFACPTANGPPTAILEIETPPGSHCMYFPWPQYPTCLTTEPRTVWSRPAGGQIAFLFFAPFSTESLTYRFRGISSTDPDGDLTSWTIDFGDGASTSGNWATEPPGEIVHTYASPFLGPSFTNVVLTVTDGAGQSDSDTIALIGIDATPD